MPEEVPEGAPDHPYYHYDSEQRQRIDDNKVYAEHFWWYVDEPDRGGDDEFFFPKPPANLSKDELTPEKVVKEFNKYKAGLLNIRESEKRLNLPNVGKSLDKFSLYDVYLKGFWDTYRDEYHSIPPDERSSRNIANTAQHEQTLALVENAMDLAGHRPDDMQVPEYNG